jgi:hypothetical protein
VPLRIAASIDAREAIDVLRVVQGRARSRLARVRAAGVAAVSSIEDFLSAFEHERADRAQRFRYENRRACVTREDNAPRAVIVVSSVRRTLVTARRSHSGRNG